MKFSFTTQSSSTKMSHLFFAKLTPELRLAPGPFCGPLCHETLGKLALMSFFVFNFVEYFFLFLIFPLYVIHSIPYHLSFIFVILLFHFVYCFFFSFILLLYLNILFYVILLSVWRHWVFSDSLSFQWIAILKTQWITENSVNAIFSPSNLKKKMNS